MSVATVLNASPPARLVARRQSARPRKSWFRVPARSDRGAAGPWRGPESCRAGAPRAAGLRLATRTTSLRPRFGEPCATRSFATALSTKSFHRISESSPTGYRAVRVHSPSRQLRYSWLVAEIKAAIYCSIELCADKPLSVRQIPRVQSRATAPRDPERLLKRGDQRFRAGAFADFLVGGFFVGLVGLPGFEGCGGVAFTIVWRAESSAIPTGLPKPVHGSHPATA